MIQKLIKSLLKSAAYPEPTAEVRLIETHVSYIFMTDSFVYKVKKPVDFGFLNFTTLDRRRFYCEEEVRLNRRLCPEIYLGVVELRSVPGGAAFGGSGTLIDYAVKMKRLPEDRMLENLLQRGELLPEQMAAIARVIGDFHGRASRGAQISAQGSSAAIRSNWEENFRQAAPYSPRTIPRDELTLMRDWVARFLDGHEDLLRARVEGGFIRECDGDLHLGNICLTDRICIFDCIEFNERFRYIDTAADIAFLLMDLEYARRADLCPPFLESYREVTGDPVPAALLNFYKANRAFVRGKVKSFRLSEQGIPQGELQAVQTAARSYFRLARGYCLRERLSPSLIITCGLSGSGKSALARELSRELGFSHLSSDLTRKTLAGLAPTARGNGDYDQGIYSAASNRATYRTLLEEAERELSCGRCVVVDATFRRAADRRVFRALAGQLGVPFFLLQFQLDEKLTSQRLEQRLREPGEISDAGRELLPRQAAEFEAPEPGEALLIDASLPLFQEIDLVLRAMGILP
jgi:uncharacterized protein